MMQEFDGFVRASRSLPNGHAFRVYEKSPRNKHAGNPMVHCRLQFRTTRGNFFAASEGWGIEPTFKVALDRLERRLLRSKELLAYNPRYAKDYLRKIGLPMDEE